MSRSSSTTRMRSGNGLADAPGRGQWVVVVEDGTPGDEHISSGRGRDRGCLLVDPPVHFESNLQLSLVDLLPRRLHFVHHIGDDRLAAEPGLAGHWQGRVLFGKV